MLVSFLIDSHSAHEEISDSSESASENHEPREHHLDPPLGLKGGRGVLYFGPCASDRLIIRDSSPQPSNYPKLFNPKLK